MDVGVGNLMDKVKSSKNNWLSKRSIALFAIGMVSAYTFITLLGRHYPGVWLFLLILSPTLIGLIKIKNQNIKVAACSFISGLISYILLLPYTQ